MSVPAGLEEEIGGRLPAAYRSFLERGELNDWTGELEVPADWPFGGRVEVVQWFSGDTLARATLETYAGRVPDVAVPAARTARGDVVAVGYDGFDAGRVWLCDRDRRASASRLESMRADLARHGIDRPLDADEVVWHWERLESERRPWRLGFADVYPVAERFEELLGRLR